METIMLGTIALGAIAKFLEFKLDKNMKDDYVEISEIKTEKYSLKNVETF